MILLKTANEVVKGSLGCNATKNCRHVRYSANLGFLVLFLHLNDGRGVGQLFRKDHFESFGNTQLPQSLPEHVSQRTIK